MTEERLPYWPAALNCKMAAAYCGLSVETFLKVCPLKPVAFTGSSRGNRYIRQKIAEWLLSIDPNGTPPQKRKLGDRLGLAERMKSGAGPEPVRRRRRSTKEGATTGLALEVTDPAALSASSAQALARRPESEQ